MKLDRYTEKAQEAILGAQRLATDENATALDVEHVLAALLQDDDGTPAATLRRLGADPQAVRIELAAATSRCSVETYSSPSRRASSSAARSACWSRGSTVICVP